jgi:citrate lyase subunit beta / citryl-CoA lyase
MRAILLVPSCRESDADAALDAMPDALVVTLGNEAHSNELANVQEKCRVRDTPLIAKVEGVKGKNHFTQLERAVKAGVWEILLDECNNSEDVTRLAARLSVLEAEAGQAEGTTRIFAHITNAQALFDLGFYGGRSSRLAGLVWNGKAFAASLGQADGTHNEPCQLGRSLTVIGSAAAGVPAFCVTEEEGESFEQECGAALRDGFAGIVTRSAPDIALIRARYQQVAQSSQSTG